MGDLHAEKHRKFGKTDPILGHSLKRLLVFFITAALGPRKEAEMLLHRVWIYGGGKRETKVQACQFFYISMCKDAQRIATSVFARIGATLPSDKTPQNAAIPDKRQNLIHIETITSRTQMCCKARRNHRCRGRRVDKLALHDASGTRGAARSQLANHCAEAQLGGSHQHGSPNCQTHLWFHSYS